VIAAGASTDKLDICVSKNVAASLSEHLGVATFGTFEGIPVSVEASMKAAWFIRGMDSGGTKMRLFTGLNHREIGDKHQASMHRRWDRTESTIGVVTRDDVVVVKVTKWCSTTKECLTEAAQKLNAAERIMS